MRLRSTTKCRPVTGLAYGLEPSLLRYQTSAQPTRPAAVRLGDEVRAVGPGVDQHAVHVGDAAAGERLDHARVAPQRRVALVELVDGHVRLLAGLVLPARRRGPRRARRPPCRPGRRRGSSRSRPPRGRSASPAAKARTRRLGRLAQLDRARSASARRRRCSRRRIATAWRISSAESGSSGCGVPGMLATDAGPSRAAKQPSRRRTAAGPFGAATASSGRFEYEVDRRAAELEAATAATAR